MIQVKQVDSEQFEFLVRFWTKYGIVGCYDEKTVRWFLENCRYIARVG
jgi:hypothetical protein